MSISGGYYFYLEVNPKKPGLAKALEEISHLTQGFNRFTSNDDERAAFKASLEPYEAHADSDVRSIASILARRGAALEQHDSGTFRYHTLVTQDEDKDGVRHNDSPVLERMTEPLKYPIGVQFGLSSLTVVPNCGMTEVTGSVTERGKTDFVQFPPRWTPSHSADVKPIAPTWAAPTKVAA